MKFFFKNKKKQDVSVWRNSQSPKILPKLTLPGEKSPLYRRIFASLLLIALFLWSGFSLKQNQNFPIKHVQVITTTTHIDQKVLRDTISAYVNHGFFGLDAFALSKDLMHVPWVHAVTIQRFWPDKVIVTVEEQTAVAVWNDSALLNSAGEIFTPDKSTFPDGLPQLSGADRDVAMIWQNYVAVNQILQPLKISISELDVDKRQAWHLTLSNGMSVFLGQQNIVERMNFFVKTYPKLINADNQIADVVDLRYQNGLAVKWRAMPKTSAVQAHKNDDAVKQADNVTNKTAEEKNKDEQGTAAVAQNANNDDTEQVNN
jgi:cell division protein FtsQ